MLTNHCIAITEERERVDESYHTVLYLHVQLVDGICQDIRICLFFFIALHV